MKDVTIYTDGACSGNPGPGGWGAILMYKNIAREISGFEAETTNNRMELAAAIAGLKMLKEPCNVALYTDSAYLCNAFRAGWLENWQRNGWLNAKKQPVENKDLWLQLLSLCKTHRVQWHKVRGHSDNPHNNRCDELARNAIKAQRSTLGKEI